ncbi:MAG: hypothetical protein WBP59_05820 [Ilumatobacteraceae bacterium]
MSETIDETNLDEETADDPADSETGITGTAPGRFDRTRADLIVDIAVAVICFLAATAWTLDPFRRQFSSGTFSNFFELQANAYLDGNLAIDPGLLGIEAFIRDGNEYMYFGPLLGLFRVPVVLFTHSFDGRLTVISLLIGTALLYWQANRLFDRVLAVVHPTDAPTSLERWVRLGWRGSVAAGTVVLTLISLPWSYHEAHLWSAAFFVMLLNQMMRLATENGGRTWIFGAVLFAVVLNRPTTAYAGMIGVALLLVISWFRSSMPRAAMARIAGWSIAAFVVMVGVNWAKFRRPFGIPMEDQFFTKVDEHRAEMLRIYDNKYFQTEFIPSNLWAYFKPNGVDISSTFPFVGTPRSVPWVWGDAFYDATYRTASVTATNPLLLITSVVGVVVFVRLWRQTSFWQLTPLVLAGLAAGGGVAGWGYMATRYLTDFLPGMLVLAAIGCAGMIRYVAQREEPLAPAIAMTTKVAAIALVVWSILANLAIGFTYSFSVGDSAAEVPRLLSIQDASSSIIGPSLQDRTIEVDHLWYDRLHPAAPGTLAILGDCEAVYYSNGEPVDTWIEVEFGESDWRREYAVTPTSDIMPGYELELLRLTETPDRADQSQYWFTLTFRVDEVDVDNNELEYALVMRDNAGELFADELEMPLDEASDLTVTFDKERRTFFVEVDGVNKLYGHFDMDPLYDSSETGVFFTPPGTYGELTIEQLAVDSPWCDRLRGTEDS